MPSYNTSHLLECTLVTDMSCQASENNRAVKWRQLSTTLIQIKYKHFQVSVTGHVLLSHYKSR